jgi:phosphoribosylformimino-5-aminoimidazole carboxamide ribotide isomerase
MFIDEKPQPLLPQHNYYEGSNLKVVPVLDVLNGVAVHAVRGEREKYSPLKSFLCKSSDPVDVAKAFKNMGFTELYVADLDAILGKQFTPKVLKRIKDETDLSIMVDAGIDTIKKARILLDAGASSIVIGTETLRNLHFIEEALKSFGAEKVVVSIDIVESEILSTSESIKPYKPAMFAEALDKMGVAKVIILDLKRVGSEQGPNLGLVKEVVEGTSLEVLTGGGIRNMADLEELRKISVSKALVATALHKGILTPQILKTRGYLL